MSNQVKPAIVQISNEQQVQNFFNQQPYLDTAGIGSGIIFDSSGHILTNDHVIAGNQKLVVALPDGRSFPATVVGADPQSDLAVIQIHGKNLPVAQLGDSSQLKVGQWVVAIGNALALEGGPTVTVGVVSALNRSVTEPGSGNSNTAGPTLVDVIQTDAAINPGNSGGALVNLNGQVIGINTLIAGQAEPGVQAVGIGFAIAINTVKKIAGELVKYGHAIHPYLGISYTSVSPSVAYQYNLNVTYGALVTQVDKSGPAAAAGVKAGDVITEIDGQKIDTDSALAVIMNNHTPGDEVTLTVNRNGKTLQLKVKLGEFPTSSPQS
ncbi:MAG TPA: trypsin-like peptidase domain-containing protein [Thermomicrobiaceae bacterium]|nr:trypsin-like peptidase domain-containing protein [Thermomicrobiaceae bacterium]